MFTSFNIFVIKNMQNKDCKEKGHLKTFAVYQFVHKKAHIEELFKKVLLTYCNTYDA